MSADVVVLDLDEIQDTATFLDPHQYPRGISLVIVNGQVAVDHGNHAKINCGKVLYGPGKQER
jgi:N-acyl-D-aspartate/D-glutamate deacylase